MTRFSQPIAVLAMLVLGTSCASTPSPSKPTSAPSSADPIEWTTPDGAHRLDRAAKVDFFPLANVFEPQANKFFCGVASAAIVLNALRLRHEDEGLSQNRVVIFPEDLQANSPFFARYSQRNVFIDHVKDRASVMSTVDAGFQLRQLADLLVQHGLFVLVRVVADDLEEETIRRELIANLTETNNYVIVNFYRPTLEQSGGGHISPVGAYDETTDSFLILDVNPNDNAWFWVPANALIRAMRTFDTVENRGYLLVAEGSEAARRLPIATDP